MNTQSTNILMIDDHPMILKGYDEVIKSFESRNAMYRFAVERAHSISQAVFALETYYEKRDLHLVLLDIGLPGDDHPLYKTGVELGVAIRKEYPIAKIIVITSYDTYPLIRKILDMLNPEGILLKGELDPEGLQVAILEVMGGAPFFTKTVRKFLTHAPLKPQVLDHYDKLLLYYLSEGTLTKDLVKYLPLSQRSIERRKNKLKEALQLEQDCSDVQLLKRAKEVGLL